MILREILKKLGKVKTELVVLSVLVPLVVILGALLVRWPRLKDPAINGFAESVEKTFETVPSVSAVPTISTSAEFIKREVEKITLVTERNGYKKSWQVEIEHETNVEKVLVAAAAKGYLDFEVTDYGGSMGVFIESLGGIANNNIEKVYWHLYINDVLSSVGASQAVVKAGDNVIWKYEKQHDENE